MAVYSSTIAYNRGNAFGGGLVVSMNGGTVTLAQVTLTGNESQSGAAIYASYGIITGTNVTISGNNATNNYGGVYLTDSGLPTSLFLRNSTIAGNTRTQTSGVGVNGIAISPNVAVTLVNTLLANNGDRNCFSSPQPTSLGNNLADDFNCGLNQTGDQQGVDPQLGPLRDNGGPVLTLMPAAGSPAIDAGSNAACAAGDARGVARPVDGDGDATAVCDIGAVETRRQVSIADNTVIEGDAGTLTAFFMVTLAPASPSAVAVQYATANGSASAGSDYSAAVGTLTFAPGETSKAVAVSILGDTADEADETFTVTISSTAAVDFFNTLAVGTIVDNDGLPTLTVGDATVVEGSSGIVNMSIVVTLSPPTSEIVTVQFATQNGTATAGSDYGAMIGTLSFPAGEALGGVLVPITTDTLDEGASEQFLMTLSNPTNATLADGQAVGTIVDDDEARLSLQFGPTVVEGDSGLTPAVFTVTLSTPAAFVITTDYEVREGIGEDGARAGQDYVATPGGTLTFAPGQTQQTFTVQVIGDAAKEENEFFSAALVNPSVSVIGNVNTATIMDDDGYRLLLPMTRQD